MAKKQAKKQAIKKGQVWRAKDTREDRTITILKRTELVGIWTAESRNAATPDKVRRVTLRAETIRDRFTLKSDA